MALLQSEGETVSEPAYARYHSGAWSCAVCGSLADIAKDVIEKALVAFTCPKCGEINAIKRLTTYPSEFPEEKEDLT